MELQWIGRTGVTPYVDVATAHIDEGLTGAVGVSRALPIGHRQGHSPRLHHDHGRSRVCVPTHVTVGRQRDLLGYDSEGSFILTTAGLAPWLLIVNFILSSSVK